MLKAAMKKLKPRCRVSLRDGGKVHVSSATNTVTIYCNAVCGTWNCKHYQMQFNPTRETDIRIPVYSAGRENHEEALTKTTQVRGGERDMERKVLKTTKPYIYKEGCVEKRDVFIRAENNWQDIKSDAVVWQMRSEALAEHDLDKDDVFDVIKMRRREAAKLPPEAVFIQKAVDPLTVYLYSDIVCHNCR